MTQDLLDQQSLLAGEPSPTSGSDAAAPDDLTCPICGREAKNRLGLASHLRKHERDAQAQPGDQVEPQIAVKAAPKLSKQELAGIQKELAENVQTIGQLLHGLLIGGKVLKLQNPEIRIRVPGTRIDVSIPDFDTHLPYTIISRSELTAKVLVEYAARNETLLSWIQRFNSWFKGGEVGQLVGAHVVAAAGSVGLHNGLISGLQSALISDVLEQVRTENYQLRQQLEAAQRELVTAQRDGRGAGN